MSGVEILLRCEIKLSKFGFSLNVLSSVNRDKASSITDRKRSGSLDSRT